MMHSKTVNPTAATQHYLKIAEIKDDTIVLGSGELRAIVAVSSTNFALKSEDEQNALINAYQGMLNSLEFPIQILVHSRILDINTYLAKLKNLAAGQTNELLRIQMNEYIEYVAKLIEFANIMSKNFYVVVPYSEEVAGKQGWLSRIGRLLNPVSSIISSESEFMRRKTKLLERVNMVIGGLGSVGLRSLTLNTEELIEVMYQSYNLESGNVLHAESLQGLEINEGAPQEPSSRGNEPV